MLLHCSKVVIRQWVHLFLKGNYHAAFLFLDSVREATEDSQLKIILILN